MKKILYALPFLAAPTLAGCVSADPESTTTTSTSSTGSTSSSETTSETTTEVTGVRGDRYCEILVGHLLNGTVHVDVYNTYGLNDCPEDAWKAVDPAQIKADTGADAVIPNGPRFWLMDTFKNSKLADPTVVVFGGLEMRLAGSLDLSLSDVQGGPKPYVTRQIARTTTWAYEPGKPVFELLDPDGKIYDMQSYSVQNVAQTEASLASLGDTLMLPSGWSFRSRVLDAGLEVTAVDGLATVVQDELGNTYQLSQQ